MFSDVKVSLSPSLTIIIMTPCIFESRGLLPSEHGKRSSVDLGREEGGLSVS